MPVVRAAHDPRLLTGGQILRRSVAEVDPPPVDRDLARLPQVEEPVALRREFTGERRGLAAELDSLPDDVLHHDFPVVLHHPGRYVERGDHVVLRRGRAVHHVRFVELGRIDSDGSAVPDMQHGGL